MNRIDHSIEQVAKRPRETVVSDRIRSLRSELEDLYEKAKNGTATQEDSDRCSELTFELRELEE